ncbi:MAG TPA: hypothetical protein VHA73_03635 [Acidimicrobiales bacterium]|nr:hypothetical protein [Acidimicrobiales bacterium]
MTERATSPIAWSLAATRAVVRRPTLWPTALAQVWRLAGKGWWRRAPFLPLPDRDYLRFRVHTAYGVDHDPDPSDIVTWLTWCRAWRRVAG